MTDPITLFGALNSLSPLAVIGLLAYVIYLLIKGNRGQHEIATNHLHGIPEMAASLERIEVLLQAMNEHIIWIRARINGR